MPAVTPSNKMPIVIIACRVLEEMLQRLLPDGMASRVTFMDYGLHRVPGKMTWELQDMIDSIAEPSLVVLGYGLCGNGLNGIAAGKHTLLVPRADDCIAILLGSRQAYMQEFEAEPGTYYLSKGWLESGSNPLSEYLEYADKYGPDDAAWVMDQQYQHYRRLVLVTHNVEDMKKYRPLAQEVARYCEQWGMRYQEILGSERYIRRLVEVATALNTADDEFVVIPPGGEIRQDQFI
jgi:hypothetical protein